MTLHLFVRLAEISAAELRYSAVSLSTIFLLLLRSPPVLGDESKESFQFSFSFVTGSLHEVFSALVVDYRLQKMTFIQSASVSSVGQ